MRANGPDFSKDNSKDLPSLALGKCLVDANPSDRIKALHARRKAIGASVLIEAALVAALLIWPLFAAGTRLVLPRSYVPMPPYGAPRTKQPPPAQLPRQPHEIFHWKGGPIPPPTTIPPLALQPENAPPMPPGTSVDDGAIGMMGNKGNGLIPIGPPTDAPLPPKQASLPASPAAPVRRSEGVQAGLLIHRVEPDYPALARQTHLQGTVQLHAVIGRDGSIESLEVLSGHPLLVKAALDAVRQWRYRPTLLGGEPVEVETYITVHFVLGY
jgi:protein TonB